MARGALSTSPKFSLGTDRETLLAQQARAQAKIDAKGKKAKKARRNLRAVNNALGALGTDPQPTPEPTPQQESFDQATLGANNQINSLFDQMQSQGAFQPQDYTQARQQATDVAMNEFNRLNEDRFGYEDEEFRRRMAAEGIDETNPKYQYLQQQRQLQRDSQVQGAQNAAFAAGANEQQTAYNQAYQTHMSPYSQLNTITPFYAGQNQQNLAGQQMAWQSGENALDRTQQTALQTGSYNFQKELAALQNKYALQQIAATPRGGGGGGLSYEQQLALQNNTLDKNFYNQMVLQGMQNGSGVPNTSAGAGFASGVGAGAGAAIVNGLAR